MTPIKQQLTDYVEFNHIKIVIALLQYKFGMTEPSIDDTVCKTNEFILLPGQIKVPLCIYG